MAEKIARRGRPPKWTPRAIGLLEKHRSNVVADDCVHEDEPWVIVSYLLKQDGIDASPAAAKRRWLQTKREEKEAGPPAVTAFFSAEHIGEKLDEITRALSSANYKRGLAWQKLDEITKTLTRVEAVLNDLRQEGEGEDR